MLSIIFGLEVFHVKVDEVYEKLVDEKFCGKYKGKTMNLSNEQY